jgi:hypothetical protein
MGEFMNTENKMEIVTRKKLSNVRETKLGFYYCMEIVIGIVLVGGVSGFR